MVQIKVSSRRSCNKEFQLRPTLQYYSNQKSNYKILKLLQNKTLNQNHQITYLSKTIQWHPTKKLRTIPVRIIPSSQRSSQSNRKRSLKENVQCQPDKTQLSWIEIRLLSYHFSKSGNFCREQESFLHMLFILSIN